MNIKNFCVHEFDLAFHIHLHTMNKRSRSLTTHN